MKKISIFPNQTVPNGNKIVDESKFMFIEIFHLLIKK